MGANHYKDPLSICKIDLNNPNQVIEKYYHKEGKEILPTEPIFIQRPNAESEDDGVLLVVVLSNEGDYISVLDAKNFKEIATAHMPESSQTALTFHGFFAENSRHTGLNI